MPCLVVFCSCQPLPEPRSQRLVPYHNETPYFSGMSTVPRPPEGFLEGGCPPVHPLGRPRDKLQVPRSCGFSSRHQGAGLHNYHCPHLFRNVSTTTPAVPRSTSPGPEIWPRDNLARSATGKNAILYISRVEMESQQSHRHAHQQKLPGRRSAFPRDKLPRTLPRDTTKKGPARERTAIFERWFLVEASLPVLIWW